MSTVHQHDLYGNTVRTDPHDERVLMFMSEYTRSILRQIKVVHGMDMMDAVEIATKQLITLLQETDISREELERIHGSTDKKEILTILRDLFGIDVAEKETPE